MQGHWINSAPYYRCRFPAEKAGFLATHLVAELRERPAPDGLEWRRSGLPRLASGRGGIARSVLSRKGSCHLGKIVAGLHASRPADNAYKRMIFCRVSMYRLLRWHGAAGQMTGGWEPG